MKRLSIRYFVLSALAALMAMSATAQQDFILDSENSKLLITGTSSIHDWEMEAHTFSCETTLKLNEEKVTGIGAIDLMVKVKDLESGKRIMDNKAHDALNEKQNPQIRFKLDSADPVTISGDKAKLAGTLEVAGKTREVEVTCDFSTVNNTTFSVQGEVPLKMTDFGIEPPTAMFGTVQTGDEILVNFDFKFTKSTDQLTGISPERNNK